MQAREAEVVFKCKYQAPNGGFVIGHLTEKEMIAISNSGRYIALYVGQKLPKRKRKTGGEK